MTDAVLNAEQFPSICPPFFPLVGGVNVSHPCLPALVCRSLTFHSIFFSLSLRCHPILAHPFCHVCLLPFLLALCLSRHLPSTPHRAMTILRENLFLFTQIITSLLLVIEPGCLVNGIVLEYNTPLNEAVVDHE